jgi:hypothetical protein
MKQHTGEAGTLGAEWEVMMATERHYVCPQCSTKVWVDTLFDALLAASNKATQKCSTCNKDMEFHMVFNFGLGAGPFPCKVLASFLPDQIGKWPYGKGKTIEFYPFLVITESTEEGYTSTWLPYWHIIKSGKKILERKYGQWAPFVDNESFNSLILKAQKEGYLKK